MEPNSQSLDEFPGVHLAVDVAVFTVTAIEGEQPRLQLLVHRRPEGFLAGVWMLPGRFVRPGERVEDAGRICLAEKAGIKSARLRNLAILDDADRDPRGWTVSIGSATAVNYQVARDAVAASPEDRMLVDVGMKHIYLPGGQDFLPFGQTRLVNAGINYLRQ